MRVDRGMLETDEVKKSRMRTTAAAAAILLAGVMLWLWFRVHTGIVLEDALITFRYARNLAEGRGFVFNEGERVLGTTTPLLTLALGLLGAIFGAERIPVIANALMMPAAAGAGLFTFAALRALGRPKPVALAVMAAFCFHPDTVWTACGGMETPLVLLFMAGSLNALARKAHRLAAVAAALLVLTRIDGLIWAIGVFLVIGSQERRSLPRALLAGAAVAAPWILFAIGYFGSIVPHSVVAKRVIGADVGGEFWPRIAEFARWSSEFLASSWPAGWPAGLAFFALGAWTVLRRPPRGPFALLVGFSFAFPLALCLGGSPLLFPWYLVPMGYAALIVGCLGMWRLGELTIAAGGKSAVAGWAARGILAALCLVYAWTLAGRVNVQATNHRRHQINEDGARRAAGEWLARNTPPDAVVAMEAVGYQAYYSGRKVIDLAGLVSPAVVALRRKSGSNAETFFRVLRDLKPDFLLLRSFEVSANRHFHGGKLFESTEQIAYFTRHYVKALEFAAPLAWVWGENAFLTIYRRRAVHTGRRAGRSSAHSESAEAGDPMPLPKDDLKSLFAEVGKDSLAAWGRARDRYHEYRSAARNRGLGEGRTQSAVCRSCLGTWEENRIDHLVLTEPGTPAFRVTDKHQMKYEFDSTGVLTRIADRNNNQLTFGYTGSDLTSIADTFGRAVTLSYSGGQLNSIIVGGRMVSYSYLLLHARSNRHFCSSCLHRTYCKRFWES